MEQGDDKPRGPQELAELLETREPVFLVGGQAVNLWALHYFERTADLAPFVSRDIDLLGNRSTLEEVALGKIWERKLIGYLETVLGIIRSQKGRSVLKRLGIDGSELFEDLSYDNLPKVRSFVERRLNR